MQTNPSMANDALVAATHGQAPPPAPGRAGSWRSHVGLWVVVAACGLFFTLPFLAMVRFALQNVPVIRLGWSTLFENWSLSGITQAFDEPGFGEALNLSARLAVGTVLVTLALLIPTAIWVHLRLPKMRPVIEFITVMPYVIPAIGLVAGIQVVKPHARWFLDSKLSLIPFYVVLTLPFTYRSIDAGLRAIDLRTLVDASRSLGAGWGATLWRVLLPNLRTAVISSTFLIVAVVLGEYTMARVLLRDTLPTFTAEYRQREPQGGYGLAVLSLVLTVVIFILISRFTRPKSGKAQAGGGLAAMAAPGPIAAATAPEGDD